MFGGKWVDDQGKSTLGSDPAWAKLLTWQKQLIDFYGYDNLVKFQAGLGDEAPKLQYGTAPVPVDDGNQALYGGGYTTGNIIGIPKRAKYKEQGWALLKFLATDDKAMVLLSNGLRNVPTTESSAKSPDLKPDPKFATFLKIYGSPNTTTTPVTAAGSANQELFNSFTNKWQAGRVPDLASGLTNVDKQIDAQLAQSSGTQVP